MQMYGEKSCPSIYGLRTVIPFLRIACPGRCLPGRIAVTGFPPRSGRHPLSILRPPSLCQPEAVGKPLVGMELCRNADAGEVLQPPLHGAPWGDAVAGACTGVCRRVLRADRAVSCILHDDSGGLRQVRASGQLTEIIRIAEHRRHCIRQMALPDFPGRRTGPCRASAGRPAFPLPYRCRGIRCRHIILQSLQPS